MMGVGHYFWPGPLPTRTPVNYSAYKSLRAGWTMVSIKNKSMISPVLTGWNLTRKPIAALTMVRV
jgi:hypothetical protein